MARREPKAVLVGTHIEPSLNDVLETILEERDDYASTYLRELIIKDAIAQGKMSDELRSRLLGTG